MSVSGLCEICDRPAVEHTCDRCGKLVCERHFDESMGVCVECRSDLRGEPSPEPEPEGPDGVDTYEF